MSTSQLNTLLAFLLGLVIFALIGILAILEREIPQILEVAGIGVIGYLFGAGVTNGRKIISNGK